MNEITCQFFDSFHLSSTTVIEDMICEPDIQWHLLSMKQHLDSAFLTMCFPWLDHNLLSLHMSWTEELLDIWGDRIDWSLIVHNKHTPRHVWAKKKYLNFLRLFRVAT